MSTTTPNEFCQILAANIESELSHWFNKLPPKSQEPAVIKLSLDRSQLLLAGLQWPSTAQSKIIFLNDSDAKAYQFTESLNRLNLTLKVSNNWHLINSQLTPQEINGQITTKLSRALHSFLSNTGDNFVITSTALAGRLPDPKAYIASSLPLAIGETITLRQLIARLVFLGYIRYQNTPQPGGFVIRGEHVLIHHPWQNQKLGLTLWRNTIEQIMIHEARRQSVSNITLPPLIFPNPSATWPQVIKDHLVFRPNLFTELTGNFTIIYDHLHSQAVFPFRTSRELTPASVRRKSLLVLYQNRDRLEQYFSHRKINVAIWCQSHLAATPLHLVSENVILISEASLLPRPRATVPITYQRGLTLIQDLVPGQPAVHSDHGIGIYEGLQQKTYGGISREYLVLSYAAGDTLAVPVEYAHKVTAYLGHAHPVIHRLNTAAWAKTKRAARADALRFAKELLAIAARRQAKSRPAHQFDPNLEEELTAGFPFDLTPDQLRAWQDVKSDLTNPHSMDRLIVGDVGFGKTEIAIRAAAHVAAARLPNHIPSPQVAVLAPTTLLVQQHYDTFKSRLPATLVRQLAVLSRFSSAQETRHVASKIASGRLKIIIGTHALLNEKINWANLALVIIDEEQRFGVRQKEIFKNIRAQVDLLSLSATPIPRTLSMALSGLKDLSIISTPPVGRRSIATQVTQDTDEILRSAIAQEIDRGGQVYLVAPRIHALAGLARRVQALHPHLSVGVAHGSLSSRQLAHVISQFDQGSIDILVTSSIIEHGLDLPNVNTIIVTSATYFGLADLYQLRGRIGRRLRQGHAYFLYNQRNLTDIQRERLAALTEASRLGSGWALARRDLEIRGAGNLLGAEQSGAVNDIGAQLYLDLVRDAVSQPVTLSYRDVEIRLPLPALLPLHYVADHERRAQLYQALARAQSLKQLAAEVESIKENFGPLPPETKNLYLILQLQHTCAALKIKSLTSQTIKPPGRKAFDRLTLDTSQAEPLTIKILAQNDWQVHHNTLRLEIQAPSTQFLEELISTLTDLT